MGSSGGGGGSGKADWPDYMKTMHGTWLGEIDVLIGAASNPYTAAAAYVPDTALTAMATAVGSFDSYINAFNTGYIASAIIDIATDVFGAINSQEIPVFEAGMSAINATQSSSFVIGEAMLVARAAAQLAREATSLRSQAAIGVLDGKSRVMMASMDYNKLKIIAKVEESERQLELDIHEETWPLDLYKYAGSMLASIGGASGGASGPAKPSKTQSALGGAMTGAATGAMIGSAGPQAGVGGTVWGAVIGAVIGGVGGYMAAS